MASAAPAQAEAPPTPVAPPELQVVPNETPTTGSVAVAGAPATPEIDPAVSAAIDDDLMKEFAAAVEGQKSASATAVPAPNADSEDLMGQFESFVQKKEGS
jgi:hypothetical protein